MAFATFLVVMYCLLVLLASITRLQRPHKLRPRWHKQKEVPSWGLHHNVPLFQALTLIRNRDLNMR